MNNIFERSIWYGTNAERLAFTPDLDGTVFFETDTDTAYWWEGGAWHSFGGGGGGVGPPTEGPGIDLVGLQVGVGGDTILLYDSTGNPCAEYAASDAGLTAALAAMGDDDVIETPAGTISGGPWTIEHGLLRSIGGVLDGELTIMSGCQADKVSVVRSEDDAGAIYGVILDANAIIHDCYVDVTNATGDAIGIYGMDDVEGDCHAYNNLVNVTAGGDGYCYATGGPNLYAEEGEAIASTAPVRM